MTPEEHYKKAERYAELMDSYSDIKQVKRMAIKAELHLGLAQGWQLEPTELTVGWTTESQEEPYLTGKTAALSEEERFLRTTKWAEELGAKVARTAATFPRRTGKTDAQAKAMPYRSGTAPLDHYRLGEFHNTDQDTAQTRRIREDMLRIKIKEFLGNTVPADWSTRTTNRAVNLLEKVVELMETEVGAVPPPPFKAPADSYPFALEERDGESLTMKQALGQFGGYLSACWSNLSGAGEFESTRASEAVDVMAAFVQRELDTKSIVHDCCVKAEANALPDRTEVEQLRKATEAWVGQPSHKLDNVDQVSEALRLLRRWLVTDTTLRSPAVLEGLPDIPEEHFRVVADYPNESRVTGNVVNGDAYGTVSLRSNGGPAHASFLRVFYRNSDAETLERHAVPEPFRAKPEEHEPEFGEPFRPGAVQTLGGTTYTATDGDEKLSIRVSDYQHEQGSVWARVWTDGQRNGLQIYVKHSNGLITVLKEETREL